MKAILSDSTKMKQKINIINPNNYFRISLSIFFLIPIFLYSFLLKNNKINSFVEIIFKNQTQTFQNTMLFIAITVQSSDRAKKMFELWGNNYQNSLKKDEQAVYLISSNGNPAPEYPCIGLPPDYQKMRDRLINENEGDHYDRTIKRVYSLEYFVKNTTFDWVALITDDVYVNLNNLKEFFDDLKTYGDPRTVPMVFGHCIDVRWVYLQGGSGYIVSRRAAELFVRFGKEHINARFEYDDIYFSRLLFKVGLNIYETSSDRIIGHDFLGVGTSSVVNKHWNNFPNCPNHLDWEFCKVGPFKLNKLAIIHQKIHNEAIGLGQVIEKNEVPDNIYWYQKGLFNYLCKK